MDDSGPSVYYRIIILIILVLINAFFAASEISLVSVDKKNIKEESKRGNKKADLLLKLLKEPSRYLATIRVGITLSSFLLSALSAISLSGRFSVYLKTLGLYYTDKISIIIITIVLSFIRLVFGELVPKRIALQNTQKFALKVIKPVYFISKIMKPFVSLLSITTNTILKILKIPVTGVEEKVTLEEIRTVIQVGQEQGIINPSEREMIDSIIKFDDKFAEEIMTARTEVFMIDINTPVNEYIDEMLELKYSRIPIYDEYIDNIIGVLYIKDYLLESYKVGFENVDIKKIMKPAYFIPESKNINDLFLELQSNRMHFAILIDEYGGFSGIVTMEDLIEEIVGDIDDEYDHDEPDLKKVDDYTYYARGSISIKELNSALNTKFDEFNDDYDTLAGLLIYKLGYIPCNKDKKSIKINNIIFNILEIEDKKIEKVKIKIIK